jgi:WD repeat-containing protein 35
VLAVAGVQPASSDAPTPDGRGPWLVQFYSAAGEHLRTLRVPAPPQPGSNSGGVTGIAWEGTGLRLALAVDSAVLLAAVRREHMWGYLSSGVLVYASVRPERPHEHCVVFWDPRSSMRCGCLGWGRRWGARGGLG